MSYTMLLENIAKHIDLAAEEEDHFVSMIEMKKVKRKQFLLQEGDIHKHYIFVTAGCLRSYSIDEDGFEHILHFATPGWWIGDTNSLTRKHPSILNIDAVHDSEIIVLLKSDLDQLYIRITKLERLFRILFENAMASYQRRLIERLSLSAKDRYKNFCELHPSLVDKLPQKDIAAYIGVTPEFLSKILHPIRVRK